MTRILYNEGVLYKIVDSMGSSVVDSMEKTYIENLLYTPMRQLIHRANVNLVIYSICPRKKFFENSILFTSSYNLKSKFEIQGTNRYGKLDPINALGVRFENSIPTN